MSVRYYLDTHMEKKNRMTTTKNPQTPPTTDGPDEKNEKAPSILYCLLRIIT